jgi:hypothetical protein
MVVKNVVKVLIWVVPHKVTGGRISHISSMIEVIEADRQSITYQHTPRQDVVDPILNSKRSLNQSMIRHEMMCCINQPSPRYVKKMSKTRG